MGKQEKRKGHSRSRMDSGQHRRILLIMVLIGIAAFLPASVRLHQLMVTDHSHYSALALRNQSRTTPVAADRGMILDRNMEILATSVSVENVYLAPRELQRSGADIEAISSFLGEVLEKDPQWIARQAGEKRQRYRQVGTNIDIETAGRIREFISDNGISGIHLEPSSMRRYPKGTLAAQVIGFANA